MYHVSSPRTFNQKITSLERFKLERHSGNVCIQNLPQQNNLTDCGVFVCKFAHYICKNAPFTFTAADMPKIRRTMMEEIVLLKLQPITPQEPQTSTISRSISAFARDLKQARVPTKTCSKKKEPPRKSSTSKELSSTMKPLCEIRTNLEGVYLHQSANLHQGDPRFHEDRRNAQCTAIAAYSIAALILNNGEISRTFLDNIVRDGDQYYVDSKKENQVKEAFLQPEELLKIFHVNHQEVTIDIDQCGGGHFFSSGLITSLTAAIDYCVEIFIYRKNYLGRHVYHHGHHGFTTFFQWVAVDCSPEDMLRLAVMVALVVTTDQPAVALDAIHVIEESCGFLPPELKLAKAILQMPSPELEPMRLSNIADIEVLSESPVSMARSISAPMLATFSRDN
ncbi:uncharacterized protein LOC123273573 [Cotesia glomerata]|nr:uncharacterized protein LOC123273573 [Cotesia glomerata]